MSSEATPNAEPREQPLGGNASETVNVDLSEHSDNPHEAPNSSDALATIELHLYRRHDHDYENETTLCCPKSV